MKSPKTDRIPNPYARHIIVQTKVNSEELRNILALSKQYFDGNISLFLRACIKQFKYKK